MFLDDRHTGSVSQSMGGRIWGSARPGGGSVFAFSLPSVNDHEGAPAASEPTTESPITVLEIPPPLSET